jgi:hypothetical protein
MMAKNKKRETAPADCSVCGGKDGDHTADCWVGQAGGVEDMGDVKFAESTLAEDTTTEDDASA